MVIMGEQIRNLSKELETMFERGGGPQNGNHRADNYNI